MNSERVPANGLPEGKPRHPDTSDYWYRRAIAAEAEIERLENLVVKTWNALAYIAGYDVAGYEPHMRPEEVAKKLLDEEKDFALEGGDG